MRYRVLLLGVCALGLGACESTTLRRDPSITNNSLGSYALPKASLSVAVFYARDSEADGLIVAAEKPRIVTGETMPLSAKFSSWSKDKYEISLDPKTGFIRKLGVNLDNRSDEIVKAAAESIASVAALNPGFFARVKRTDGAESGSDSAPRLVQIAEAVLDPTDAASIRSANETLWRETLAFVDIGAAQDCRRDDKLARDNARTVQDAVDKAKGKKAKAAAQKAALKKIEEAAPPISLCRSGAKLLPPLSSPAGAPAMTDPAAALAVEHPFVETAGVLRAASWVNAPVPPPSAGRPCAAHADGICVRAAREFQIALKAPQGPQKWRTARLPATGAESVVNVDRAILADKSLTVDFTDGVPGDIAVSQESAAENIARTPKIIIDAAADSLGKTTTALSKIIPLRIDYRVLRRPDESIEVAEDAEDGDDAGEAPAAGAEGTKTDTKTEGEVKPAAAAPPTASAAAPPTTTVSVPGATGAAATVITIAPAAPPAAKPAEAKPEEKAEDSPTLWFTSCAYGLLCKGALDDQITKVSTGGSGALEQPTVAPATPPTATSAGTPPTSGGPAKPTPTPTPSCTTAEDLKKPECKPVSS